MNQLKFKFRLLQSYLIYDLVRKSNLIREGKMKNRKNH